MDPHDGVVPIECAIAVVMFNDDGDAMAPMIIACQDYASFAGGVYRSPRRDGYVDPPVKDKFTTSKWIDPPSHSGGDHTVFNRQIDVSQNCHR